MMSSCFTLNYINFKIIQMASLKLNYILSDRNHISAFHSLNFGHCVFPWFWVLRPHTRFLFWRYNFIPRSIKISYPNSTSIIIIDVWNHHWCYWEFGYMNWIICTVCKRCRTNLIIIFKNLEYMNWFKQRKEKVIDIKELLKFM